MGMRWRASLAAALLAVSGIGYALELETRTSRAEGVTVKVTPRDASPVSATWLFAVVLDTHSQELGDDVARISVLIDAQGTRHPALAWQGAPPGGHHREGVLRFRGLGPAPGAFALEMRRAGERAPRVFRWNLK